VRPCKASDIVKFFRFSTQLKRTDTLHENPYITFQFSSSMPAWRN